jgi:DnaJ-class molecular chaperone
MIGDKDRKIIRGLGMPFHKDSMSFGNLIIDFKIEMPKRG